MRRKQANPKPVKVEGDEMPGTTDSAQSQQSPSSSAHGQSCNRESSDVEEDAESLVIDTGSVPSALSDSPDLCEPVDSPEKYSIIELHRSVEMVYYPDGNVEDADSQEAMSSDSCDKDMMSLSGSVSNSEISNNLSSVSLADISFQETDPTSAAKSKHSLSKSRKKTDRILPQTGVDGEKKYFCPVCEDAFSSEHDFTRHIRSHNSPTNVSSVNMCMICQKVLSSQSSLDRHMLVHSGERPFKCDTCGQAFTTNGNMHRHMRTHKAALANAAGLPNELVPKIRKKKKQAMPPNAEDAAPTQQLQRQVDLTNSVGRSTMNRKRKIADASEGVELLEKRRTVDSDVVKYLLTLANNSHDSAMKSSMIITQNSARIDPTKYPLQCSECHTTFFSRFHLLTDLEEHERSQRTSLPVTCVACEVKLNCVNDFGDHMLSAHCSPKEGTVLEGSENIKPAFNDLMAVVPFTSERFSQMYKIITEKPSKHQVQKSAVNYCFGCEQMSEKSYGCQTKKLGPNCSGSFCDFCRFFFYKCEQQKDHVLWQERDVILSGYSNQKMDNDKVIQDKMAKTEFLHMLDLKSLSESKIKHPKNSLQFDTNQNVIKVLPSGEKPPMTLKSLPLLNVLQNSILPKLSLTEGTVNHVRSSTVGEETLVPNKAPVLNFSSISAKHIVALIEGTKILPIPAAIKIDLPRLLVGSPGLEEEHILPRLEDPMNSTIKLEDDEREISSEATDQALSSTPSSLQFKCSQCPYSSTDRSTLVRHMRTHNGERPFKCLYCNYQFTTKANCERHIKKKHSLQHRETGADDTNCIQLPADSSTSARSHSSGHYQCKVCPKNFASRANLLRHMQRQHAGLDGRSIGGNTGVQSRESLVCNGLTLLANEAENCSRHLSSNSEDNVPLQLTTSNNVVEARHQPQTYRGYTENAEDSDEPLDFSLKSQRTSAQSDCTGGLSWESDEPIDLTIRGQSQQRRVPRECENSRSGRRLTVPQDVLKLPSPAKGTAGEKAWIKKQLLPSVSATKGLASDLHSVIGHFCCAICQSVFKYKVELSIHMRSHNIETDSPLRGEASSSTLDVKPDSQVKTVHPQFTVVASSTFSSSSSSLNKKLDFDKSPVLAKEPNNNVASSVNANFVNKPLETKPLNLLKGDLASVNQILESTSGKQLQPLLAMTSSTASPSLSPSTSFHGLPDLAVSTMSMDHSFADAISKSIAQNIILKNKGASGKREAEVMDDDELGAESRTIKKKRNSYADSPRKLLCEFCTRAFPWISSLKRHILTHTGQKPYRCKQCGTTFSTKSNRERHMIRKHGLDVHDPTTRQTMDRPYKCHLCVFSSFTTSGKLMRHYKVKHPDKEVPETLLTTSGSLSLDDSDMMSGAELLTAEERAEMQSSDEDDNEDPTDDEVNELTYQMMAKSRLMQTMNNSEAASCSVMTPVNGGVSHLFMVATKDNADGSAEKHINPERDNYNVDKITDCWKCKRTFNDRKTLLRHLKEHNIDLPFKCYLCDASFEDRLMSLEHKHDEHPSDWATVQEKNKVSNLKDYSEFMEAVVKDTLDGKVTRRTHEGVELDIKPEPDYAQRKVFCTLCPKRFWSLQDLRRHMRSHTGDRPFECDICLSRFTLKHSMVRHRRKHMTEGLGASGETPCSASDEDSVHTSTTPVEGCAQSPPKMSADSPDESATVNLSMGQILPCDTATASTHLLVGVENSTELSKSSSSSCLKIVVSPSKPTSSADHQSDLLQTLLDIDDKSTIDRMLESPTNAASMLGIRRPKNE